MSAVERVVGVGSSAGGLEALTAVLKSVTTDVPFAFIIAQHMAAEYDSPLVGLLRPVSQIPVREARDGALLEPGVVEVCPPDRDIVVDGGRISLRQTGGKVPHPSVDLLLSSLADQWGSRAVGVVLSGSGADGAEGIRAIHDRGGIALAQEPQSAQFSAMPDAAIATGCVDLVFGVGEFGPVVSRLTGFVSSESPDESIDELDHPGLPAESQVATENFATVVNELRRVTGVDFSEYKQGTLQRQIARRQALTGAVQMSGYVDLLRRDKAEAQQLGSALLVPVTGFFRDPDAWSALSVELTRGWSPVDPGVERRIWVPGCATGEEAYTVAMLVSQILGFPSNLAETVKIFATDLREDSLAVGRRGVYSEKAVSAIPGDIRARWWRQGRKGWEVSPSLRDAIVFARHDVTVDPPFPRLDLVSVRNTLIYFRSGLQARALRLFQYSLLPGGLLFLGQAERVSEESPHFDVVDATHRIYRRADGAARDRLPVAPLHEPLRTALNRPEPSMTSELLDELMPPSLVVDANDDVVEVIGDVGPWCWVAPGPPSSKVVALVREELRTTVRTLLLRLRHGDHTVVDADVTAGDDPVTVTAHRLGSRHPDHAVITFTALSGEQVGDRESAHVPESTDVEVVTRELATTQAALQATVEDLSSSNEELRALNEELQASTEEAQSANEELQASNEELSTLNQELQVRTAALLQSNQDLENIQASVSAGLILVDKDLRITRFTAPAVRVFALIDDDIGRELVSIPTTIVVEDLGAGLRAAVQKGTSRLFRASGHGGDYLIQIQPYLGAEARVLGAVVVVTDVTEWAAAQRQVEFALQQLNAVTDAMADTVWQRDSTGRLLLLSRGVEKLFGLSREKVMADPELLRAAVHPDDRERAALAVSDAGSTWDLRYRIVRPDGTMRWVRETARPMAEGGGEDDSLISGFIRDVTDLTVGEQTSQRRLGLLEAFFSLRRLSVLLLDEDAKILRANDTFTHLTGSNPSELIGMPLSAILPTMKKTKLSRRDSPGIPQRHRLVDKNGAPHWISFESVPLGHDVELANTLDPLPQDRAEYLVMIADLTPSVTAAEELQNQVRFDTQTGLLSRSEFKRRVEQELARTRRSDASFAVLWIDLDGFKEVNDTHGHRTGDLVLTTVAQRVTAIVRGQDNVGRLGGDEFAVIVADSDGTDGLEVACERVLAAVREPIVDAESTLYVSASIGIAVAPEDGANGDTLLHNADTAMYAAKRLGGDTRAYFQPLMNERAKHRGQLRQGLAEAVRSGDFRMFYQPMVELAGDRVIAVEALIRWERDGEMVAAADFIEDARLTGQLRAVGRIGQQLMDRDLATFRVRQNSDLVHALLS